MDYRPQRSSSAVVVGIDGGAGERKGRVERHGRTSFVSHDTRTRRGRQRPTWTLSYTNQATTEELYIRLGLITCETIYDGGRGRGYRCDKEGLERHGRRLRCRWGSNINSELSIDYCNVRYESSIVELEG